MFTVQGEHSCHNSVALVGDTPTATTWDFRNEAVDVESFKQPGDARPLAGSVLSISTGLEQLIADVPIPKAMDGMLAPHDGCEELDVLLGGRVEPPVGPTVLAARLGQRPKALTRLGRVIHDDQCIQVSLVDCEADLGITAEVGDALGHRIPAHDLFPPADAPSPGFEFVRTIDHGLDPQYAPLLVVHFYPVVFHPMPNAGARPAFLVVVADVAGEVSAQLSTEEGHHILGAEAVRGVLQQFFIQTRKGRGTFEHDVGGKLSLLDDPVVVHAVEQMLHQRIDSARQGGEDSRPVPFGEPVGESPGASGGLDPQKRVVDFPVGDSVLVHLAGQPVVAVETNLKGEGEPRSDPHVQQAELAVDEVEIQAQALAGRWPGPDPPCGWGWPGKYTAVSSWQPPFWRAA